MSWTKTISIQLLTLIALLLCVEFVSTVSFFIYRGHFIWSPPHAGIFFANEHLSKHYLPNDKFKPELLANPVNNLQISSEGLVATTNVLQNNNKKILLMGGSTIEGIGASGNHTTIASYLSRCLASSSMPYEVLNGGRSGLYSYTEYRLLLETFLPKFKPEIVISINGRNDSHYSMSNELGNFKYHSDVRNSEELMSQDRHGIGFSDYLRHLYNSSHTSRIIRSINKRLKRIEGSQIHETFLKLNDAEMDERADLAVLHFNTQIQNTKNIVEAYGGEYFHFLQPTLMFDKRVLNDVENSFILDWESRLGSKGKYQLELNKFYEKMRISGNMITIDLSDLFNTHGGKQLYSDSVHYNDQSNQIIANSICKYLKYKKQQLK